jgi:XTP/dITP diphosphohydrolase
MESVLIATENSGKIKEFEEMFATKGVKVKSLLDVSYPHSIEETGSTFEENAIIKANALAQYYNMTVIADDSGLEIDALDGEPGVYSARYAGAEKSDEKNMDKVLKELAGVKTELRTARFVCALAVVTPGEEPKTFRGICNGIINDSMVGSNGFGYDPIFYLPSFNKTMAQLPKEEKNKISHRANALKQLMLNFEEVMN